VSEACWQHCSANSGIIPDLQHHRQASTMPVVVLPRPDDRVWFALADFRNHNTHTHLTVEYNVLGAGFVGAALARQEQ